MCRRAPGSWRTPTSISSSRNASTRRRPCSAPPRRRAASRARRNGGSKGGGNCDTHSQRANEVAGRGGEQHRGCDSRDCRHRSRCRPSLRNAKRGCYHLVADYRTNLAFGRNSTTCWCADDPREAPGMTSLQLYLLISPFVLLAVGAAAVLWAYKSDREPPRARGAFVARAAMTPRLIIGLDRLVAAILSAGRWLLLPV